MIFITPPIISIYNSIQDNNTTIQHEGLLQMRKVLSSDYPHIELFANSGIIVLLSNLLLSTNENIRMETAWCLTNIATGIDTLIMNIHAYVSINMNINAYVSINMNINAYVSINMNINTSSSICQHQYIIIIHTYVSINMNINTSSSCTCQHQHEHQYIIIHMSAST